MTQMINDLGVAVCAGVGIYLVALLSSNVLFMLYRDRRASQCDGPVRKPLEFHSPDDSPRTFKHAGFRSSLVGAVLLYGWVAFFAVGYFYMILFCWFSYAPQFFAPPQPMEAFGGWNGLMGPWLVIFTLIHIVGMILIMTWEALRTRFMVPVGDFADATHVMIEEDLVADTDETMVDPDSFSYASLTDLKRQVKKFKGKYKRAIARTVLPITADDDGTRRIEYTCVRYVYSQQSESFHPTGHVDHTPQEIHEVLKAGGLTAAQAEDSMSTCGRNEINVYVPGILESLLKEFSEFTYIFNSIGTWSYMVYSSWNIGTFWLLLTMGSGIFRSLFIVRPNQKKIQQLARLHTKCQVLRDGHWRELEASQIVLGDIVAVDDNSAVLPCDGIVIEGSLVVNESMLTGEPMPIQKMPVENSKQASISKKNIAYAGTTCLQSSGPHDGKAVMIAKAVGALTTRGQLVRMVLFPTSVRFKYNDQLPKVYGLICIYMVILMAIYLSPLVDLRSWIATYLLLLNTIAMCLSPMLPVSMVMGQSVTAKRLEREHEISCLQPGRIPIAGKISTMVFDKTGTITKDGMDFSGVVPVEGARFMPEVTFDLDEGDAAQQANQKTVEGGIPGKMRHALACCHTVTTLRDGTLVGNQVEVSMVRTGGWAIDGDLLTSPSGGEQLEVIKKLDFDHCRMTSGAVVRRKGTGETEVFIKGSYEKVHSISMPGSVPVDYDAKTQGFAKQGYYVLGIASKSLPAGMTPQQVADLSRDSLESGLSVCGLLLFRNEMKHDSAEAIAELRHGAVRSVICTGDNALTGISVGRQCGIVETPGRVLLGNVPAAGGRIEWRDPDVEGSREVDPKSEGAHDYQLAVTQSAWRHLHANLDELEEIWMRLVVFARMKPEDKINVVKYFQSRGFVVGMCGDGGNDCGGLRAAHAGLALSDAEASMVSPFSTGRDGKSLITVVDLIREGRACLATNLATFQYFLTYSFVITGYRTFGMVYAAITMPEYVWVSMDVGIGLAMVWTMTQSRPTRRLCGFRPTATLLGPRTASAIFFPIVTSCLALTVGQVLIWNTDWYEKLNPILDMHLKPSYWMLRGDNYDSAVNVLALFVTLTTTAYVNTYGGSFRRNICHNIGVNVVYAIFLFALAWLLLSPPTQFNCVYRVNCDMEQSLHAGDLTALAAFSAGGVGGCFLGPQVLVWQEQMTQQGWGTGHASDSQYWLPHKEGGCVPPAGFEHAPLNSTEISQFGCVGPNNCFSWNFKVVFGIVLLVYIIANHLFTKVVLLGAVSDKLRKQQRRCDRDTYGDACAALVSDSEGGETESGDSSEEEPSTERELLPASRRQVRLP